MSNQCQAEGASQSHCKVVRQRKQRTVNNAYIDVDSVSCPPGEHYSAWISISKQMLKKRECVLLTLKIAKIESIVNEVRAKFMSNHAGAATELQAGYKVPESLSKSEIFDKLHRVIDEWNGVNLLRLKKDIRRFRDYFVTAKNWWDLTKKKRIGLVFWITILEHIDRYLAAAGTCTANTHRMKLHIVSALFAQSIQYANTKAQPLINNSTLTNCKQLHQYLLRLDAKLDVEQWIVDSNSKQSDMHRRIQQTLNDITRCDGDQPKSSTNVNSARSIAKPETNTNDTPISATTCSASTANATTSNNMRVRPPAGFPVACFPRLPPLSTAVNQTQANYYYNNNNVNVEASSSSINENSSTHTTLSQLVDILNQNYASAHHQMPNTMQCCATNQHAQQVHLSNHPGEANCNQLVLPMPSCLIPVLPSPDCNNMPYVAQRGTNYTVIALRHSPLNMMPAGMQSFGQTPVSLLNLQYPFSPNVNNITFQ